MNWSPKGADCSWIALVVTLQQILSGPSSSSWGQSGHFRAVPSAFTSNIRHLVSPGGLLQGCQPEQLELPGVCTARPSLRAALHQ